MNILFLTIGKMENINESGIYTDLLNYFSNKKHNVFVVCSREKRTNQKTEYITENGINFLWVKTGNITRTNIIEKGISTLTIEYIYLKAIKKYLTDIKFDLVLYSTPPITFAKIVKYIKKKDEATTYLLLKDIFPQNAVDLEMISKMNPVYWYFRIKEKKLYQISDFIGCMSQANVNFIKKNNPEINSNKLEICPNSIDPLKIKKNVFLSNKIKIKYGIPINKIIFIYGGNLGKPQGIDFLIDCLRSNSKNTDIFFVIAGSGTEFNKLKSYFDTEKPNNAKLLHQLSKKDYETLVSSCDIGLIFLDHRFTIPNYPSRLLSYLQAKIPVLAVTDQATDIGKTIKKGKFGFHCLSNDLKGFNDTIKTIIHTENLKNIGLNGWQYLNDHFTVEQSYNIIMSHFIKEANNV